MRKAWVPIIAVIGLLLLGLIISHGKAFAQTPIPIPPTCTDGNNYVQAGAVNLAENVFNSLLTANPQDACALAGLQKVAGLYCQNAQKQADDGDIAGARTVFTSVLQKYSASCASDGLAALPTTCADADSYVQSGVVNLAENAYNSLLTANPHDACALAGLQKVAGLYCQNAKKQADGGDIAGARTAYTSVLQKYGASCASDGLAALPVTCALADNYVQAGAVNLAENAYNSLLTTNPQDACALAGLQKVAGLYCQNAQKQAEVGDIAGARTVYTSVLQKYSASCASDGLAALPTGFEEVKRLVQIGAYNQAWAKLQTAITANPDDRNLQALAGQPWAFWQAWLDWPAYFGVPIASALISIAIILLALIWWVQRWKLKLNIVSFEPGMVKLDQDLNTGPKPDKALIAKFEEELSGLGNQDYSLNRPDLVDTPLQPPDLPANLGSVPEEVISIWNFITKLIPANVVQIKGVLEKDSAKGAGLYLKLVNICTNELWGSYTVWQSDLNPAFKSDGTSPGITDFMKLSELAATWAYFYVYKKKSKNSLRQVFGTDDPRCYYISTRLVPPLFEEYLNTPPDPPKVKEQKKIELELLIRNALACDRENYNAQLQLGHLLGDPKLIEFAKSGSTEHNNPVRITANYLLGIKAIEYYESSYGAVNQNYYLKNAKECLVEAVKYAEEDHNHPNSIFPEDYIAMLKIPYAYVLSKEGNLTRPLPDEIITEIENKHYTSARVLYNLACYFTMINNLDKALKYLKDTLRVDPGYANYAKNDKTLDDLFRKTDPQILAGISASYAEDRTLTSLVGSENAKCLQTAKVETAEDLLREASTRNKRRALASKIAIDEELLLYWTKAVELVRIKGIEIGQVLLLDAAGISSLDELEAWKDGDVTLLHDNLEAVQKTRSLHVVPDLGTLKQWIESAKNITTQVEV